MGYNIMEASNLSYNNAERTDAYLIIREGRRRKFNMPISMAEFGYLYPGTKKNLICQSTLDEIKDLTYTREQVNNKIEDLEDFITDYMNDQIRTNGDTSPSSDGAGNIITLSMTPASTTT